MYTVPMACFDDISVFLFGAGCFILLRDLYSGMSRGTYTLFGSGLIEVFTAGFLKATHKLLYALGVCDFRALKNLFFPLQSIGFLLAGIAIVYFVLNKRNGNGLYAVTPIVLSGTAIFISFMVLGLLGLDVSLILISARLKKKKTICIFVVSFVLSLMLGYLATKDFTQPVFNWLGEGINALSQGLWLLGIILLDKAGLSAKTVRE